MYDSKIVFFINQLITEIARITNYWKLTFAQANNPFDDNWGASGAGLAFAIGLLNAVGALLLVYAFRYGKATVVSPMVNCLPPIVTSLLSLWLAQVVPNFWAGIGMLIAILSAYLLAVSDES